MAIEVKPSSIIAESGATRILARFASHLKFRDLPGEVKQRARACILDTLGSTFLGSLYPWGNIIAEYAAREGGKPESTILGRRIKVSAGHAALANGTMAHGFEVDDVYIPAIHHPGSVVVPAALSAAEREGATGQQFLAAVVAGYEVMNRIGEAATESHLLRGFFPTGTNGVFGAAAAAGNLLHLSEEEMTNALGIAGSQSSGMFEGIKEGRMTKRFGAGRAAQSGLLAADLAKLGFTGSATVVEGEWGYLRAYSDRADLHPLTEKLGEGFTIAETTFKPYPCCKGMHAAIDGMLDLNREYHFDPQEVEAIIIGAYEKLVKMHDIYEPATPMAAQFSIPYVVSVAFLKGKPGVEDFTPERITDPAVLSFARFVKIVVDPEVASYFPAHEPSKVTVKLRGGKSFSKIILHSKGTPQNPMGLNELEEKFRGFASRVIPGQQTEEVLRWIRDLESKNHISELSGLLVRKS